MSEPLASRIRGHDVDLQLFEWPGTGRPIFLAHATGFHARCWNQVVARMPGRHVYAIDMRGHGLSEKHAPPYPWRNFGRDVAAVVRELALRDVVAVGHSKGGFAVTMAAAMEPQAFAALVLVDPVILPPEAYELLGTERPVHFAARRRNNWASAQEMFERFAARPPFSLWDPAVLHDYCDYGLIPNPVGEGLVLACPPEIEAAVYAGSAGERLIYDDIAVIEAPTLVMRARTRTGAGTTDMSASPTYPDLWKRFKRGQDMHLESMSHFLPMEDPALVAAQILDLEAQLR